MQYEEMQRLKIALRSHLALVFNLTLEQAEIEALRILRGIKSEGFAILKKKEIPE